MTLAQLFFLWPEIQKHFSADMTVLGLATDTRQVKPGYVFIALRGNTQDGHDFIADAVQKGCLALVVENASKVPLDYKGFVLVAPDTRETLDLLAAHFFGAPSFSTFNIGVTGTNGKTSVTHMIEKIFNDAGRPCAVLGTIDHHLGELKFKTELTTPGPLELQERLKTFVRAGAKTIAMEVSSHALDQKRIHSVQWNTGVFTNLTQDHLDYHQTMENYFFAKEKLFRERLAVSSKGFVWAVVNTDDQWGRKIRLPERVGLLTYGMKDADITAKIEKMDFGGIDATISAAGKNHSVRFQFTGGHNVLNALAAIGTALTAMIPIEKSLKSLSDFISVPGRLERVPVNDNKFFFVDYAHTPDALENVLSSLRKIRKDSQLTGKIHTVFGCGGDRDKTKRPLMFDVAKKLSDFIYVTSDNPRTEDPFQIIAEVLSRKESSLLKTAGWDSESLYIQPDRALAIQEAGKKSGQGDIILIAGKGHEDYQIIGKEKSPFSDHEEIRKLYS